MADRVRVAIIGSGPAGLSAAGRAAQLGLSHVLLEKTDHLSDTIYKYQKGKHVMATPSKLVLRSDFDFDAGKREVILSTWDDQAAKHKINVRYRSEVKAITGERGNFSLELTDGNVVSAECVVLAIGTQGNPNLMRCKGAELPHVQYQLDDPGEYVDEHITVIGSGDAGIENALGLAADAAQGNVVTILNRSADFARAKSANVKLLNEAAEQGRIAIKLNTTPGEVREGELLLETRDGTEVIPCDRIIARMGSAAPRAFIESCGIEFTSSDREAFPKLSPEFETTKPGIFVIGALAGYPLIKHCMNQGYDVLEFINGNTKLKPADEPLLEAKFERFKNSRRTVDEWLEMLRNNVTILNELSPLQMREFLLDSEVYPFRAGEVIFERDVPGSSLFAIAEGTVLVEVNKDNPAITVEIPQGSIVGEVGLISGRRRGATVRAGTDAILVEVSRTAALKLMASVPAAKRAVTRISVERQLLQMFKSGLSPADLVDVLDSAEIVNVRAGEAIITEGDPEDDVFVVRIGSMMVEKQVAGKPVFLSYLPASSYVGAMSVLNGGRRAETVRAAVKSEVIKLQGAAFRRLLEAKPALMEKVRSDMAGHQSTHAFVESRKDSHSNQFAVFSQTAKFLVDNGIGEATDVLLINEKLCVGCDNCERACADSHEGLSRLDREAGRTYAHLHVPTSCRHCEHPHCMSDFPPNAIQRGPDGEVFIEDSCIGCGNCQRNCPYGVIRMEARPSEKPGLLSWMMFGSGPGPGEPSKKWRYKHAKPDTPKKAVKCDMCSSISGGPACVRACPTGAAIRVAPESFLTIAQLHEKEES
jgi:thioredoxin reductase/CRP-like cAMP-binding protein/Fe-S-cluster-containing hydrogenase component 2